MRATIIGLAIVGLGIAAFASVEAGGAKEVTLKGTITCAKCDIGESGVCATVIVTKDGDKNVTTYFDAASNKKYHKDTCMQAKAGTVTGVVSAKDNKRTIAVSAVKYD